MSHDQLPNHETFRCVACPGPVELFPSFLHFKDVSLHSMKVHMVALERAVQASTLLPTTLTMVVCKLCPVEKHSSFLTEEQLKIHLVKHSQFFAKRWKEFSEVQCRVCEKVIDPDLVEDHMSRAHSSSLFADPKEVSTVLGIKEDSDLQRSSSQQPKSLSGGLRLKPIDFLLDQSKKQSGKSDGRAIKQVRASPAEGDPSNYSYAENSQCSESLKAKGDCDLCRVCLDRGEGKLSVCKCKGGKLWSESIVHSCPSLGRAPSPGPICPPCPPPSPLPSRVPSPAGF